MCTDIDECLQQDSCDQFATCENAVGSFNCTCEVGFTGDGVVCSSKCIGWDTVEGGGTCVLVMPFS